MSVSIPSFLPISNHPARFQNVVDNDGVLNGWKCSLIYLAESL